MLPHNSLLTFVGRDCKTWIHTEWATLAEVWPWSSHFLGRAINKIPTESCQTPRLFNWYLHSPPYSFFVGIVIGSINGLMDSEPIGDCVEFWQKHPCMLTVTRYFEWWFSKDSLSWGFKPAASASLGSLKSQNLMEATLCHHQVVEAKECYGTSSLGTLWMEVTPQMMRELSG